MNLADDQRRLLLVVRHCEDADFLAALLRAPQFLRAAPRVIFDERVRGAEDEVRRAVVLLQLDHRGIRKVRLEFQNVRRLRAAPAVDGLVVVAHDRDVALLVGEQRDEVELQAVRVLEFVHHDVAELPLPALAHIAVLAKQPHREQEQIIKVHRVQIFQLLIVARVHCADERLVVSGLPPAGVLRLADHVLRKAGIQLLVARGGARDDLFDQPRRVALVVDREVFLVAELLDVLPQDAHAQRVKGGHHGLLRLIGIDHRRETFAHFFRGLVRESDREDVLRRGAARDEECGARGDHARLAAARAGEDEQRALGGSHRALLLGIQIEKSEGSHFGRREKHACDLLQRCFRENDGAEA